jgi:hypothetical protein
MESLRTVVEGDLNKLLVAVRTSSRTVRDTILG